MHTYKASRGNYKIAIVSLQAQDVTSQNQGRTDLTGFFHLAIPVFHAYGHKVDCQVINFSTIGVLVELQYYR